MIWLRLFHFDLNNGGAYGQLAWSWQKRASMTNRYSLWQKDAYVTNRHGLDKKERLWPISLVLTKGTSAINWLNLDERVSATNWLSLDKRVSVINWLDLVKKERLRPTGLVLTKGMFVINWLDLDKRVFAINWLDLNKKERLQSIGLILTKRSVCDQLAWSWLKERLRSTGLILMKGRLGLLIFETKLLPAKIKFWNQFLIDKGFAFPLLFEMWSLSWFELYQENFNWQNIFLLRNISFLKFKSFEILISTFETLEKNSSWNLEFKIWNFEPLEFLKSRLGILIMKFEVWVFIENWRVEFKIWTLRTWTRKFGNKNFELKIWDLGFWPPTFLCLSLFLYLFYLFIFFFFVSSFSTSLPPLSLFTLFFPLDFLLHLTISSHKKYFSKLLKLPSSISINISLDPYVLEHFITYPFLVNPIFQNPFSLHQNGFFLQGIFFSCFSW